MRSVDQRRHFVYPAASPRALPTLILALAVWAAIFGIGIFAWSVLDMLR